MMMIECDRSYTKYARAGFSLMEIMIAVMILGLVAGLVGPKVYQFLENAKITSVKSTLKTFKNAIQMYKGDIGVLPSKLKDLVQKPKDERASKKWKHAYLDKDEIPEDSWGNNYSYKITEGSGKHPYELLSYGPNGKGSPKEEWINVWNE